MASSKPKPTPSPATDTSPNPTAAQQAPKAVPKQRPKAVPEQPPKAVPEQRPKAVPKQPATSSAPKGQKNQAPSLQPTVQARIRELVEDNRKEVGDSWASTLTSPDLKQREADMFLKGVKVGQAARTSEQSAWARLPKCAQDKALHWLVDLIINNNK